MLYLLLKISGIVRFRTLYCVLRDTEKAVSHSRSSYIVYWSSNKVSYRKAEKAQHRLPLAAVSDLGLKVVQTEFKVVHDGRHLTIPSAALGQLCTQIYAFLLQSPQLSLTIFCL